MNKKLISFSVMAIFLIGITTAVSVDFFYSQSCPHCQKVLPIVNDIVSRNNLDSFNPYDVNKGSYDIDGVPLIKIHTSDGRTIILQGSQEIPRWFECEIKEMSSKECPTYSPNKKLECNQSLFIK